ncbi:MAG: hypothetical protein C4294_17590 [Nitrospiraceae bacterium]
MPRLLLIVDEFQVFFAEDDTLASQAASILEQLARQGRSGGHPRAARHANAVWHDVIAQHNRTDGRAHRTAMQ